MGRMWFRLYTNGLHKYHSITTLWTDHVWSYTGRKSRGMADAKPYTAPIIAVNEIDFSGLGVWVGLCWRVADQLKSIKSSLIDDVSPETPSVKLSFPLLSNRESAYQNYQHLDTERTTMASDEAYLNLLLWQALSSTPNYLLVGYFWPLRVSVK